MTINRGNYESWFILYIDRELNDAARQQVEEFLRTNPDLQTEFDQLKQVILPVDETILFTGKDNLYKFTSQLSEEQEEKMLLSLDNELSPEQEKEWQQVLTNDSTMLKEWETYQSTKFNPDLSIVHPNKASLYRNEEDRKPPVIFMGWKKWAVAAALLLVAGATWIYTSGDADPEQQPSLANGGSEIKRLPLKGNDTTSADTPATITPSTNEEIVVINDTPVEPAKSITGDRQTKTRKDGSTGSPALKTVPLDRSITPSSDVAKKDEVAPLKQHNNLPTPRDLDTREDVLRAIANNNESPIKKDPIKSVPTVTDQTPVPSYTATTTSTITESESGKKNKYRGFFRKVTRVIEKGTNVDISNGDEVSIAGFAIKM